MDFAAVAAAALPNLPLLVARWLPEGRREGREWVARNPTRADRRPGSFKVNLATGRWADFATGDKGGDAISLAAHLHGLTQLEAARRLAEMLGVQEHFR
jgi:DNA primase